MKEEISVEVKTILQPVIQRMFDGLYTQSFQQSMDVHGRCSYRGIAGLKCAVGHIIPDEKYEEIFDYQLMGVSSTCVFNALDFGQDVVIKTVVKEDIKNILQKFQGVHDDGDYPEDMEKGFLELASHYGFVIEKEDV